MTKVRKSQSERSAEARGKILMAAQKLFGRSGFDGVTVKAIAAEAGVKQAAIVYYFENKERVYLAVFQHYAEPILKIRSSLIQKVDARPSLKAYVQAFIEPAFDLLLDESLGGPGHALLLWRLQLEPEYFVQKVYEAFYEPVTQEFRDRIFKLYGWVDEEELDWRIHLLKSMFQTTLGKYAMCLEDKQQLEQWMLNRDRLKNRVVDMAVMLLTLPDKSQAD